MEAGPAMQEPSSRGPQTKVWIVAAALAGTLAATYPLFVGRSLVSPGNGPVAVLYDQPPFVYGWTRAGTEHVRGADVGSMMWAILPNTMVQREALAHGEFPLWNRANTLGQPLWGQGQGFALDPFHLASLAIPDPSWAMDARFVLGRAVFAAGSGLTVFLATGQAAAGVLVALAAPFAGHFVSRLNHPASFSIVYTPWILLAFAHLARSTALRARAAGAAWLGVATWLQLVGGTPKEGVVAIIAAYLCGGVAMIASGGTWRDRLGRIDAVMLGGIVALLLGAPHWLVFLDTLSRAWTAYDQPAVYVAGTTHLAAYVIGAAQPGELLTGANPLVVLAALTALARPRALLSSPLGVGALVAAIAMGAVAFGLVPPSWVAALPLLRNVHHVYDAFLAATVPLLLVLAGIGVAASLSASRLVAAVVGVAAVALATLVPLAEFTTASAVGLASVAGAAIALLALPHVSRRAGTLAVAIGLVAAVAPTGLHLETGLPDLDTWLLQPQRRANILARSPALQALAADGGADPYRVGQVDLTLFQGTQAYWGLEGVGGPDAVRLPQSDALPNAAGVPRVWGWRSLWDAAAVASNASLLDMWNVKYLVVRPDQAPPHAALLPASGDDLLSVVARPSPWPRAFVTSGVERHRGVEAFVDRLRADGTPFASVEERELDATAAVQQLPSRGPVVPATDYVLTPNTTAFRVVTAGPGLAVLGESFVEKDFAATLNGTAVDYIRVNHAFKGVVIPGAGTWDVRFEYRPALWRVSWLIAAVGLAGCLVLWLKVGR